MITLAEKLGETTLRSLLVHKASRLGLKNLDDVISTAVSRGCRHYSGQSTAVFEPPSRAHLPDDELTILLLSGENRYNPVAIRCAAQLARSPFIAARRLAHLAIRFKTHRVLTHIARAGIAHDPDGLTFWSDILAHLPPSPHRPEPDLPHWSRFVSMPGIQRNRPAPIRWLSPVP